jgi:hypothetical protein
MIRTRSALALALVLTAAGLSGVAAQRQNKPAAPAAKPSAAQAVKVYLRPTCGCCGIWVEHMEKAGFKVTREARQDLDSVPERQRVPAHLRTCHTAVLGNYLVEGHVPVDLVQKMLKERPKIAGIAVPGMPIGSPGMEGPNPRPYSIIAFQADGTTSEYARR